MNLSLGRIYIKLKRIFLRLYDRFFEEDILSSSAQVAFYLSFSLFPLLLFLVNLFGIILGKSDELRIELFSYLRQIMPYSAYSLVQKTIIEASENSSGGKLTLGFLIALWSASAGMDSLRVALNGVYNLKEIRPYWKTKLQSLLLTLVLIFLMSFALGVVFYGWKFFSLILVSLNLPIESSILLMMVQWITFLTVLLIMFGMFYNFLPNQPEYKYQWLSYGAVTAIVLWLLLTGSFRVYLHFFNNYDKTYGSLGAVIILMLWLYLTSLVILIGGALNSIIEEMRLKEKNFAETTAAAVPESV